MSAAPSSALPVLPAGARILSSYNNNSKPNAPTETTYSRASAELVDLRVTHLLPQTTQRAQRRIACLKQLFVTPRSVIKATHAQAIETVVSRLRLTKSVRNVKRTASEPGDTMVGQLCLPFFSCASLADPGSSYPTTTAAAAEGSRALLVTGAVDGLVTVWDTQSCQPMCSASTCVDGGSWGRVRSLASHPTAPLCFSTTMFDHRIRAWKMRAGECASGEKSSPAWELNLAASTPVAGDNIEAGHVARINRLAVDPTGSVLASTSDDTTLRLWDVRRLDDAAPQSLSLTARNLQQQQQQAGASGDHEIPLRLTHDGYAAAGPVTGVAFHPDGSLVSTADAGGRVVSWDTRSGQLAFVTAGALCGAHLGRATCVAWSPCGVRLASAGADHVVQMWDARMVYRATHSDSTSPADRAAGSPPYMMIGHDDVITSLSFYTDAPSLGAAPWRSLMPLALLSTSLDGTVRLWDADTGLCARTLHADGPVYDHCRLRTTEELDTRAMASSASSMTAFVTVGHSKYWSAWGVVQDDADFTAQRAETETAIVGLGGAGSAVVLDPHAGASDESDEDEMAALRKPPSHVTTVATNEEEEDDDEEDEMAALRRK